MITKECFYYEETDTPKELSEGVAWVDPGDGSNPYPDLVTYRDGEWMSTDLDGDLVPIEDFGKVVCIQKLEFPDENVLVMRTLEKNVFKNEMRMAQAYQGLQPDRSEYWKGYIRGLRKGYHGENFGTAIEHAAYCEAIYSEYTERKMLGQGYRDGLRGEAVL
jgi:hypothetical protein